MANPQHLATPTVMSADVDSQPEDVLAQHVIVEPKDTSCARRFSIAESGIKRSTYEYSSVFKLLRGGRLNVEIVPSYIGPGVVHIGSGVGSGSVTLVPGPIENVFFILSPAA